MKPASVASLHADMDLSERRKVFAGFEDGTHELVAAPRLLDEGIAVPAADLALVLASSRSKRQMIQRMGRVVRRKDDGRIARVAIVYVEDCRRPQRWSTRRLRGDHSRCRRRSQGLSSWYPKCWSSGLPQRLRLAAPHGS